MTIKIDHYKTNLFVIHFWVVIRKLNNLKDCQ
jgi:hypothetical protein